MDSVYCAVRIESLNNADKIRLQRVNFCLKTKFIVLRRIQGGGMMNALRSSDEVPIILVGLQTNLNFFGLIFEKKKKHEHQISW